jgi:LysR family hydrogen peroxide-inducible transcriptional activator
MSKLNFSLTQIEYALAVHKHGHFAKAALACNVTQPTLSMQIKKLEDDLGVTIFDRSKKPILLTKAGTAIIDQLQTLLFEARKVEVLVQASDSKEIQGQLTVGVIPTVAPYLLPLLLPVLSKKFSKINFKFKEMQTQKIVEALETDEIDVGCLALPLDISKIFEVSLYFEPFLVLCRNDHELSKQKKVKNSLLRGQDVWLLEEGHCFRNQMMDICSVKSRSAKNQFDFESGSLETLKNIVDSFGGYTLLPALAAENLGSRVKLIPFDRPIPARQIGLSYRRAHFKNELIEALGDAILEAIPAEVQKLRQKDLEVVPL